MPNLVNTLVSDEYTRLFSEAEGLLLVSSAGLTVAETEQLRVRLDEGGVSMRMVRNSLARRALAERGFEFPAETFVGNVSVVVGGIEGTIHAAKVLTSPEVKKVGKIALLGAVFDGSQLDARDAVALAGVPDKQTLRAQLLGVLQGPARGLAMVLNALPSGMARVLQARVDAAGEPEPEEAPAA